MDQQLLDYVKNQLNSGYTAEQVRDTLLEQGWNENDIQQAFSSMKGSAAKSPPVPKPNVKAKPENGLSKKWIVLIVIVAFLIFFSPVFIGMFFSLGMFNPAEFSGRTTTGFTSLGVPTDWDINSGTGTFEMRLTNNKIENDVTVKSITAKLKGGSAITYETEGCRGGTNDYMTIGPGGSRDIDTYCTALDYPIKFSGLARGTSYSIDVIVLYSSDGYAHTDVGTVTGVVS
ncbi:MAG: hypothetical protein KAS04_01720 [Candidatus Aenigmarchaeota archaeon]|nr:hypothetical protein [Candidatus Aenigmarchaeota archaeon]